MVHLVLFTSEKSTHTVSLVISLSSAISDSSHYTSGPEMCGKTLVHTAFFPQNWHSQLNHQLWTVNYYTGFEYLSVEVLLLIASFVLAGSCVLQSAPQNHEWHLFTQRRL